MEYFINFPGAEMNGANGAGPSPNGLPVAASADSDYVFVVNGDTSNIPIVLLLGWAGCQDKYLMKYSKIYEDRG